MADRFPLVVDSSNNNIKELPSGDNLDITGCGIITSSSNGNIGLTPHGTGVVRIDGTVELVRMRERMHWMGHAVRARKCRR